MKIATDQAMEKTGGVLEVNIRDVDIGLEGRPAALGLPKGSYVEIEVSDTGPGVPPEVRDAIFEPYFTTKRPGEGTGMGLAVVHGIVESYGGKIAVDSRTGQGALFTVYLPITKKRGESPTSAAPPLPEGSERILVIDDEVPIAKMTGLMLQQLGYAVATRTGSLEALELFRSKTDTYDLVITDMTMPNMTGDRLAAELIAIRPDIPVILCTGYSKRVSEASVRSIGIRALVYKPIVKVDLARIVRRVLQEAGG